MTDRSETMGPVTARCSFINDHAVDDKALIILTLLATDGRMELGMPRRFFLRFVRLSVSARTAKKFPKMWANG